MRGVWRNTPPDAGSDRGTSFLVRISAAGASSWRQLTDALLAYSSRRNPNLYQGSPSSYFGNSEGIIVVPPPRNMSPHAMDGQPGTGPVARDLRIAIIGAGTAPTPPTRVVNT